jgi:hypothetical protein
VFKTSIRNDWVRIGVMGFSTEYIKRSILAREECGEGFVG